jgi:endonuclease YncB( thermonuclease family)
VQESDSSEPVPSGEFNLAMVQAGHAWRYRYARKTGAVAEAERSARREGVGLWAVAGVRAPWEWRKGGG